jgi:hypothetical protein
MIATPLDFARRIAADETLIDAMMLAGACGLVKGGGSR